MAKKKKNPKKQNKTKKKQNWGEYIQKKFFNTHVGSSISIDIFRLVV